MRLIVEMIRAIGPDPDSRQAVAIGRLTAHLVTLRRMSLSVAGMLARGEDPALEAAVVKDVGAVFDQEVQLDATTLEPMVTWGTSPDQAAPIGARVPDPQDVSDLILRQDMRRALNYMGLEAGMRLSDIVISHAFIGSCTNARIEDLRDAASVVRGKHVAEHVRAMIVPGSTEVRDQAEAEGLAAIFIDAGFEWRQSGCSMCLAMNDDVLAPGDRCASSTNRNFEGRQGAGARTHLMSPAMVAAAAITGRLTDIRHVGARP